MPGIFCQGLLVYDADGEVIYSNPLPDELAAEGIDFAKSRGVSLVAFCKVERAASPSLSIIHSQWYPHTRLTPLVRSPPRRTAFCARRVTSKPTACSVRTFCHFIPLLKRAERKSCLARIARLPNKDETTVSLSTHLIGLRLQLCGLRHCRFTAPSARLLADGTSGANRCRLRRAYS
jgi:hypothetical protein